MEMVYKTIENDLDYLRQVSKEVDLSNDNYKKDVKTISSYCIKDSNLRALASVQIGIPKRLIYVRNTDPNIMDDNDHNEAKVLINPVIIKEEGLTRYWETCASCLDNMGLVERPYKIEIEYFDADKKKCKEIFEGFSATVIAHEMDHLDGILHIDKALKIYNMKPEDRKEFRKEHPYEVISKDNDYKKLIAKENVSNLQDI